MNVIDDRAKSIFLNAAEIAAAEERRAFVESQCAGDDSLRREVEELLRHQQSLGSFLESPALELAMTIDHRPIVERAGTVIGPYKLLQQIGEGGMGVVFMAEQTRPIQRTVAVKIIKPGMDTRQVIARFEAERQALAMMDHPNIAKVLDAGTTDSGRPYFVMELVKGVPITKYCDEKHLPLRARLELLMPVCQAVQHAHQKGVIHRDIKPSNVLVAEYDDQAIPKVIDFGVAKATAQKLTDRTMFTEFGQVIGTLEYMSPEQAKLNQFDVDTRSDIYSLGVLLYELLTGSTPFGRKRLQEAAFDEMLRIIREEEPPKPSTRLSTAEGLPAIAANRGSEPKKLNGLVKGELDWVVMKALEKNRNMRYETAIGLALDLQRYLEGEPVLAHPPSATYRLRKFLSKNRGPALTAGVVFLALLGGVAGTTLGMIRAGRAERQALGERDAAVNARKEAFEVLTDLTDNTVGALLAQNSSSSPAQRPFLERVVARYERLARDLADSAEAKAMSARCVEQVGRTYLLLGDNERAIASLSQASDLLHNLHIDAPNDPELTKRLIDCLNYLATASHRMQRSSDFDRLEEEALQIAISAHKQFPKHGGLSQSLAVLYSNRASRRWADAKARLVDVNESIAVARELVAIDGLDPKNLRTLAIGLSQAVHHFSSLNDVDQARSMLEEVEGLAKDIELDGNSILAECYESYGGALDRTTQQEAAIAAYRVAADFYELQAAQSPGDADNAAHAAHCYDLLEKLLRRSGRQADADVYLRRALALAEKSVNRSGGEAASLGNYIDLTAATARSHFAAGRRDASAATLDRLIAAGRRLIIASPMPLEAGNQIDREDARRQAHRFRQLADLSNQGNRWEDTIVFAHKELEFARLSAKPGERSTEELFTLMESGNWSLILALDASGKLREARPFWEELIRQTAWETPARIHEGACRYIGEIADKIVASGELADPATVLAPGIAERTARIANDPNDVAARSDLWRGYRTLGGIQECRKHFQEAFKANEQGIAIAPLLDAHSQAMTQADRDTYSLLLYGRAVCGDALGREAEAEAAWAAARKFSGSQYDQSTFENRAITMARNGQGEWAVRLAEQVMTNPGGGGLRQYNAGCIYSLASTDQDLPAARREELARRAVALLVESKSEGLFDNPVEVANAKTDKDLDPLRQRDDFRQALPEAVTGATIGDNALRPPVHVQKETKKSE